MDNIYLVLCVDTCRQHPDMFESHRKVVKALKELGCQVIPFQASPFIASGSTAFEIWSAMMNEANVEPFLETITKEDPSDQKTESPNALKLLLSSIFYKLWGGKRTHTIPAALLAALDGLLPYVPKSHSDALIKLGQTLKQELSDMLGNDGVILWPGLPTPAPRHDEPLFRLFDSANTSILNTLEFPSAALPLGLGSRSKLPVGCQVVANHKQDHLCIAVAMYLESKGIAKSPSPYDR